jgi:putative ABC transport system permease protein
MREWLNQLKLRLSALWRSNELERDLEDEMAFHLAMREEALREDGATPVAARDAARKQFGNAVRTKESMRELWRWGAVDRLWQDLRFGMRLAGRQPSFTAIVVATLALGIGATTAMFTIVDAVMLRPFSLPDADRLVVMWDVNPERNITRFSGSAANYVEFQAGATAFGALGAFEMRNDNRTDGAEAERINGAVASAPFFRALGVQPAAGRFFLDSEDRAANRFVAVLGHDYWRRSFNGDAAVVGRTMVINGEPHTIVGVMPPMRQPFVAEIWRPLAADPAQLDRGSRDVTVVGRLGDGKTMAEAEAQLRTIASRLAVDYPTDNGGWSARLEPLYDAVVQPPTRRAMLVLMGAVGMLLLIACVNVANLMLARGTRRQREVATRLALGASRWRVARQLLIEAGLLSAMGGAAGLLVAIWSLQIAEWVYPDTIAGGSGLELNGLALGVAALLAVGTTFIVAVAPALHLTRVSKDGSLSSATRGVADSARGKTLRYGLVVSEIALALVLLVGAGLLLRSVDRLRAEPLGFAPDGVVTAGIGLYGQRYESYANYVTFVDGLVNGLEERPGIAAAGISSSIPFGGGYTVMRVRIDGGGPDLAAGVQAAWRVIGGNYLTAMGIPLKSGRIFSAADDRTRKVRATIINDALAERLWPGQDPLGRHMLVGDARRPYEIVGVTASSRMTVLGREAEPAMYFHYRQFPWASMALAVRADGSPAALVRTIRATVSGLDREQPVADIRPMTELVNEAAATPRMNASVLAIFAALALTLAAIGVYGVMSYFAAQRTGEIGVRLALGARPFAMFSLVWLHGLRLSALGMALGLAGAALLARGLGVLLYDVSAFDPQTYAIVLAVMLCVTVIACYLPARRAMRVEPSNVLRHE